MSNVIAELVKYKPFPNCENQCNGSPGLTCNLTRAVCVSLTGLFAALGVPADQVFAEALWTIPAGEKFRSSPFRDVRNYQNAIGSAPVAPEIQAASLQVRLRRYVSQLSKKNSFHHIHQNYQSVSYIECPFINSFLLDGEVDLKRWVYVLVRILYTRSPNVKGRDPTLFGNAELANDVCPTVQSGASKVFVASNGPDYYGNYIEFAITDERQPVSVTTTAIGVKNPDFGEGEVLFTTYDFCRSPCRLLCLTSVNGQQKYKGCFGAFKISSAMTS